MPTISFIVLTYNSSRHIDKLFESLRTKFGEDMKSGKVEVIFVDNKSEDDTVQLLEKAMRSFDSAQDRILVVKNNKNSGFAAGINIGAKSAKGKYLVFINPDSVYESGGIFEIVAEFEKDQKLGIVGGGIKNGHGMEKSAGRFMKSLEVLLMCAGLDESLGVRFAPRDTQMVDFVSGGFMIVKRELFEKLGGFDEDFFMYVEDMEFCFRVKKAGYKVMYNPSVMILHEGQGSSSRAFAVKNIFNGLLLFQKKHGGIISYQIVKMALLAKASSLVLAGKILNNKYLIETYKNTV